MGWIKKLVILFTVAVVVVASVLVWQWNQFVTTPIAPNGSSESKVVMIKAGSSAQGVARTLAQQDLLHSPKLFAWYLRYQGKHQQLKAGEFNINPTWTVDELIEALIDGSTVQYPVTLIAGHTVQQTLQAIQQLPKVRHTLDVNDIEALQALFKIERPLHAKYPYAGLEGWLLPETYHYQAGDSDKQILLRAYRAMQKKLETAWQSRDKDLPLKTPYEALILASIVEKETGVEAERPLIAGVFVRRLNKRMRLQTDPTVIYGIGQSYDGNIRKRDLNTKTDYNTYQINGLPPTPIALPSAEAIDAVMHPAETKALYFVAKGGGAHHFSNTLVEHNRAVRKYILNK